MRLPSLCSLRHRIGMPMMRQAPCVSPNPMDHFGYDWHSNHPNANKLDAPLFECIAVKMIEIHVNIGHVCIKFKMQIQFTLNEPYCEVRRSIRAISLNVESAALHGKYSVSCFKYLINSNAML